MFWEKRGDAGPHGNEEDHRFSSLSRVTSSATLFFIYFKRFVYFLAVLSLCLHWAETFSSCRDQGLLSNWGVQATPCRGFSLQWLFLFGCKALGHAGFSSCRVWAQ